MPTLNLLEGMAPPEFGPQTYAEINRMRTKATLPALAWSPALANLAAQWAASNAQRQQLDHGNSGVRIATLFPGRASGEVIAEGQRTPQEVVAAWMTSIGHRRQLLGEYGLAGVGAALSPSGRLYWCADFVAGSHDVTSTPPIDPPPPIDPVEPPLPVDPPVPWKIKGPYVLHLGIESQTYSLKPGDTFVFEVQVRLRRQYAAATRSALDLTMELRGGTPPRIIAADDNSGLDNNPFLTAGLTRGTYRLHVQGANPSVAGPFRVRFAIFRGLS